MLSDTDMDELICIYCCLLLLAHYWYMQGLWGGGGFSRYIGTGPGEPIRGMWISKGPHSLSHRRSYFEFFSLFLADLEKLVCKIHLDFSIFFIFFFFILVVDHHSHLYIVVLLDLISSILREVPASPWALNHSCSALQNFTWMPWVRVYNNKYFIFNLQKYATLSLFI